MQEERREVQEYKDAVDGQRVEALRRAKIVKEVIEASGE